MSEVLEELAASSDPLENDLAKALVAWQNAKSSRREARRIGYEPRDIRTLGAVTVIESRVRSESNGFDEIPPEHSYEALVLKYRERFPPDVVELSQKRLDAEQAAFAPTADHHELEDQARRLLLRTGLAVPAGVRKPAATTAQVKVFFRDPHVRAYVLKRARGNCEACGGPAPFRNIFGDGYLEIHHLKPLAQGGSDTISNAVALCPNCHRAVHHAEDAAALSASIYRKSGMLIPE